MNSANINQVSSGKDTTGVIEGQIILDEPFCKPTVLANARKLIEDKTRFEPEEIQPVSESENFQPYGISVCHVLDAKPTIEAITGHFVRHTHDKNTFDPVGDATNEVAVQLINAANTLEVDLSKPAIKYNQVEPGLLLRHPHKHWYLSTCGGCAGAGKNSCGTCYGKGRVTCHRCSGGRIITCDVSRCSGGKVNCPQCGGQGRIPHQVAYQTQNRYFANGSWQVQYGTGYRTEYRNCNGCYGGKINCSRCSGTGRINCPLCSASGQLTCSTCSGSGELLCQPCVGSGKVGQAAWVDVHVKQEYSYDLPETTPQDVRGMVEKEGLHGLPLISDSFKFVKTTIDNQEAPRSVTATFTGEFRVARQEVNCEGESAHLVAYGSDLRWWTLDGIIERLLQDDLNALTNVIVESANEGIFSSRIDHILANLKHVAASEINFDIVEAVLANKEITAHKGAVSDEYSKNVKNGIQVALRRIYVRRAKGFAWKTALAGMFFGIAVWVFSGAIWAALSVIAVLIISFILHKRSVRNLLTGILGTPEVAKRVMDMASKGRGGLEAASLLSMPSVALALVLGFGLPTKAPFTHEKLDQSILPDPKMVTDIPVESTSQINNEPIVNEKTSPISQSVAVPVAEEVMKSKQDSHASEKIVNKPHLVAAGSKLQQVQAPINAGPSTGGSDSDSTLDSESNGKLVFAEALIAAKNYTAAYELAQQVLIKYPGSVRASHLANLAQLKK